jgi:4-hydroxy-4-methyl-2-oxoglutarate aldolase
MMIRIVKAAISASVAAMSFGVWSLSLLAPTAAHAQLFTFSKQELIDYTASNPFERFPDGRPKVPDKLIERARGVSSEEIWSVLPGEGFPNQFADGFHLTHADKKLVGRVFTLQFMPVRPDVNDALNSKAAQHGISRLYNQTAIDMLQPGDVLVVDLFNKKVHGTIVGDNLYYYVSKVTHNGGIIVDGALRDLDGISEIPMPAYYRSSDPSGIGEVMLSGINVPIHIGGVTVMPGDLAVGDREGVYFIPPQLVKKVLDHADEVHIHDEWTKKMFDTGKYKSSDIYGSPKDPQLKKEYADYLKKHLEELHKQQ